MVVVHVQALHSIRRTLSAPRTALPTIARNTVVAAPSARVALVCVGTDALGAYRIRAGADDAVATIDACSEAADTGAAVIATCPFIEREAIAVDQSGVVVGLW